MKTIMTVQVMWLTVQPRYRCLQNKRCCNCCYLLFFFWFFDNKQQQTHRCFCKRGYILRGQLKDGVMIVLLILITAIKTGCWLLFCCCFNVCLVCCFFFDSVVKSEPWKCVGCFLNEQSGCKLLSCWAKPVTSFGRTIGNSHGDNNTATTDVANNGPLTITSNNQLQPQTTDQQ